MNNLAVIQSLYAALARKDFAAAQALFAPDIEWIQAESLPNAARHVGPAAVMHEVFDKYHEEWNDWQFTVHQFIDAGSTVVSLGEYSGVHRETEQPMRAAFAHIYDLRDGKITRFRQYADTARIRDALPAHIKTRPF